MIDMSNNAEVSDVLAVEIRHLCSLLRTLERPGRSLSESR
jgi:hypothetical protein